MNKFDDTYIFSIDFSDENISGWVIKKNDSNLKNIEVELLDVNKNVIEKTNLNTFRPDLVTSNLHRTGICGFVFHEKKVGNIYTVNINDKKLSTNKTSAFIGGFKNVNHIFTHKEISRDDFSIMKLSTDDISNFFSDIELLKILIIRLRRNKRGNGLYKNKFHGYIYPYQKSDFSLFYKILTTNISFFINSFDSRNLISILETISDHSSSKPEKNGALAISNLISQERNYQTILGIYSLSNRTEKLNHFNYFDGLYTNSLINDDSYLIFIDRNICNFKNSPLMKLFFIEIVTRIINFKDSLLRLNFDNCENSEDIFNYINNISSLKKELIISIENKK
jgi:hypothetical protein